MSSALAALYKVKDALDEYHAAASVNSEVAEHLTPAALRPNLALIAGYLVLHSDQALQHKRKRDDEESTQAATTPSDAWFPDKEALTAVVPDFMTSNALFNLAVDAFWRQESVAFKFTDDSRCAVFLGGAGAVFCCSKPGNDPVSKEVCLKGDVFHRRLVNLLDNPRVRAVEINNNQGEGTYVTERRDLGKWTPIFTSAPVPSEQAEQA